MEWDWLLLVLSNHTMWQTPVFVKSNSKWQPNTSWFILKSKGNSNKHPSQTNAKRWDAMQLGNWAWSLSTSNNPIAIWFPSFTHLFLVLLCLLVDKLSGEADVGKESKPYTPIAPQFYGSVEGVYWPRQLYKTKSLAASLMKGQTHETEKRREKKERKKGKKKKKEEKKEKKKNTA